ncbi:hypothetical protein [Plantibacter sp. CFBP 8775]|uniref:hypothetical protein n=1 Tax=Plantibacter sp. CFBP 8775 TaxID=2774038 RepID=UPI00177E7553|nr:hypothetical protein [Plantibacter sp. CFBP 8775]MBD8104750.1 hypothetical protein [Plantibacter sp. CFBP 8775]
MPRTEGERFWSHVIQGPTVRDCWFWVGAISGDGYGRFWIRRDGSQRAVRPHHYAYELAHGIVLERGTLLEHSCDAPLCVKALADPELSHLAPGTQRSNMIDRARKGRHENAATTLRLRGTSRKVLAERSRALRTLLLTEGWNTDAIAAILAGVEASHPRLF